MLFIIFSNKLQENITSLLIQLVDDRPGEWYIIKMTSLIQSDLDNLACENSMLIKQSDVKSCRSLGTRRVGHSRSYSEKKVKGSDMQNMTVVNFI